MAPPVFSHLYSKSRNLLSQLYKWPPRFFGLWPPRIFGPVYGPVMFSINLNIHRRMFELNLHMTDKTTETRMVRRGVVCNKAG